MPHSSSVVGAWKQSRKIIGTMIWIVGNSWNCYFKTKQLCKLGTDLLKVKGSQLWNSISGEIKAAQSLAIFKHRVQKKFQPSSGYEIFIIDLPLLTQSKLAEVFELCMLF